MKPLLAFAAAFIGALTAHRKPDLSIIETDLSASDAAVARLRVAMAYNGIFGRTARRLKLGPNGRTTVRRVAFSETCSARIRQVLLEEIAAVEAKLGPRLAIVPRLNPRSRPHDEQLMIRLRKLITARRWTAVRLARELHMNRWTVERLLRGTKLAGIRAQQRIADFLRTAEAA